MYATRNRYVSQNPALITHDPYAARKECVLYKYYIFVHQFYMRLPYGHKIPQFGPLPPKHVRPPKTLSPVVNGGVINQIAAKKKKQF